MKKPNLNLDHRFSTMRDALEKAGFKPPKKKELPREEPKEEDPEVTEELKEVWDGTTSSN